MGDFFYAALASSLFCTLLLAACEVRSYLDIDMSDLSNGTVSVQVGFDEQFREAMEEFGGGADLLSELESDAPARAGRSSDS